MWLRSSTRRMLAFTLMSYSVGPTFAVPPGKIRFCALMAATTSCGARFFAFSAGKFRSTEITRVFPPYGHGTNAPRVVESPMRTWFAVTSNNSCSDIFGLLKLYCRIGTVDALYWMINGGWVPGGIVRTTVCAIDVI